jgi:hypothetical protein
MRVGQKNKLTYRWATKGSRPRAVHDQRTQSTYVFECGLSRAGRRRRPWCCRPATPKPCSFISMRLPRKSPRARTPSSFLIKPDGTSRRPSRSRAISRRCRCLRVRPSSIPRKTSGSSCATIGCQPHLQILRRYRRPLLLCLEYADRPTLEDHVHCSARLGNRASVVVRIGISLGYNLSASQDARPRQYRGPRASRLGRE